MKELSIFTKIIKREIPAKRIVYEDDEFIAIEDIHPLAPVHILVIPKQEVPTITEAITQPGLVEKLISTAVKVAQQEQLTGFRLVINTGEPIQDIYHLHVHLMGGWKTREEADTPSPV